MKDVGPLVASGRDSDIFEYGPGLVLRRSRRGSSMATEAKTMEYVRRHGFPAPAVHELSDDGTDLVMERIVGPTMMQALGAKPWTLRRQAATLAEMHQRLHEIDAPEWVRKSPAGSGPGTALLHLDLHPENVILTTSGPVVIDWPNAAAGDPGSDVAVTWTLLACATIPGGKAKTAVLGRFRNGLVSSFLGHFEMDGVRRQLAGAVEWKTRDANMSETECEAMRTLARTRAIS